MKKITLSVMILAFVASSITLWLLESPLKYMLYFFEAALILIMRPRWKSSTLCLRLKHTLAANRNTISLHPGLLLLIINKSVRRDFSTL